MFHYKACLPVRHKDRNWHHLSKGGNACGGIERFEGYSSKQGMIDHLLTCAELKQVLEAMLKTVLVITECTGGGEESLSCPSPNHLTTS